MIKLLFAGTKKLQKKKKSQKLVTRRTKTQTETENWQRKPQGLNTHESDTGTSAFETSSMYMIHKTWSFIFGFTTGELLLNTVRNVFM